MSRDVSFCHDIVTDIYLFALREQGCFYKIRNTAMMDKVRSA